jgi:hypothetical protein
MHFTEQDFETRIRVKRPQERFPLNPQHAGVALGVGSIQPREGLVALLAGEDTECCDNTRIKTLAPLIARTMASAYNAPGMTSRGAIQQRSPCCSRLAQSAAATAVS